MGLFELELTMVSQELAATKEDNVHLKEGRKITAQNLMQSGFSVARIAEIMALSIAEVKALLTKK